MQNKFKQSVLLKLVFLLFSLNLQAQTVKVEKGLGIGWNQNTFYKGTQKAKDRNYYNTDEHVINSPALLAEMKAKFGQHFEILGYSSLDKSGINLNVHSIIYDILNSDIGIKFSALKKITFTELQGRYGLLSVSVNKKIQNFIFDENNHIIVGIMAFQQERQLIQNLKSTGLGLDFQFQQEIGHSILEVNSAIGLALFRQQKINQDANGNSWVDVLATQKIKPSSRLLDISFQADSSRLPIVKNSSVLSEIKFKISVNNLDHYYVDHDKRVFNKDLQFSIIGLIN